MPGPYGVAQMGCGREGQGRAAARPLCSGRVVTQGPSESPSHLTVTALRARTPLSLRDISPHCGESPFDKGAFFPCGGSGELPNLRWRKARRR